MMSFWPKHADRTWTFTAAQLHPVTAKRISIFFSTHACNTLHACLQVRDFRNDVILAEACRQDVDTYCSSVTPGDGKVHQCLVDHQEQLTTACRAETNHLQMTAASNVKLSPSLGRACAAERAQHCAGVTPGKARVFNCLLANADAVRHALQAL